MFFTLGTYSTPNNSSWFTITTQAALSPRNKKLYERQRWNIHTVLISDTQANLTTLIQEHEAGMRQENVNLTFYEDDGTETAHKIVNANTANGVTFKGISFPAGLPGFWGSGSEYAEGAAIRHVVTQHEADVFTVEDNIVFYSQSLQYSLGGFDYEVVGALNGSPQEQITMLQSPFWAAQTGIAIGMFGEPTPPSPIVALQPKPRRSWVKPATPRNFGRVRNWGYPLNWFYYFESPGDLKGSPPENP